MLQNYTLTMDLNELWIGDKVKILSLNVVGTFQGEKNGKAIVQYGKVTKLIGASDLTPTDDEPSDIEVNLNLEDTNTNPNNIIQEKMSFKGTIDLHIEKLNPKYKHKSAGEIRHYQVNQFEKYLAQAVKLRHGRITVIHGRGSGVLKQEVKSILETHKNVSIVYEINNGGALEVWLK